MGIVFYSTMVLFQTIIVDAPLGIRIFQVENGQQTMGAVMRLRGYLLSSLLTPGMTKDQVTAVMGCCRVEFAAATSANTIAYWNYSELGVTVFFGLNERDEFRVTRVCRSRLYEVLDFP